MAGYSSPIMDRLNAMQGKTLVQKCLMMEDILATVSTKDLRPVLPTILEDMFDFDKDTSQGWQLDRVFRSHHAELFSQLLRLLGPEGGLMRLVNSLQSDSQALYEFPLKALPAPSRHMIEEGTIPSFYINKLHGSSCSTAVLMLNAFELFMFHLAHALVSPAWRARGQGWSDLFEFLYPALVDAYLVYFLPCDKKSLPSVPFSTAGMRSSIGPISPNRSPYPRPPSPQHPGSPQSPNSRSSLFKASFLQAQRHYQQSVPVFDQAEAEIWRSETFLQVIAEFWINQNSMNGNEVLSYGSIQFSAVFRRDPLRSMFENVMPSLNQVKMVRLLVKYAHHFANSADSSGISLYQMHHAQSPLDHFKRSVIPHILQKKMYTFLRHAFDRWPLDSCFRMVLETWLSYIQPWRYIDVNSRYNVEPQHSDTELNKYVDDKWEQFVEDNLLFYTVLTAEFIPRVLRLDLTSPYSAYMVYRVSRILSLPNLSKLIHKAEQELFGDLYHQADLGGSYLSGGAPGLAPALTVPGHMLELEGSNFQYVPFFSDTMKYNMSRVVDQLALALQAVKRQRDKAVAASQAEKSRGFLASLFSFSDNAHQDGLASPEKKRLPGHLECTIHNFCTTFILPKPAVVTDVEDPRTHTSLAAGGNESLYLAEDGDGEESNLPECMQTEHGLRLTDLGRRQLINRERKFDTFDLGDPDLGPVRSYESATLVRMLFHFSAFINSYFSSEFTSLYQRPDFLGQLARVFLSPPLDPRRHKSLGGRSSAPKIISPFGSSASSFSSSYTEQSHRPRISLRFLASYRSLIHFGIVYLVQSFFLGFGVVGFVFMTFGLALTWGVLVATLRTFTGKASVS